MEMPKSDGRCSRETLIRNIRWIEDTNRQLNIENVTLRRETEELKAKLDKAKDALRFYGHSWVNQSYGSADNNPSRRLITDHGQRARTTLEELE